MRDLQPHESDRIWFAGIAPGLHTSRGSAVWFIIRRLLLDMAWGLLCGLTALGGSIVIVSALRWLFA